MASWYFSGVFAGDFHPCGGRVLRIFSLLNVLLYFSNAQLYFFQAGFTSFKPFYWYLVTLLLGSVFLLLRAGSRFSSPIKTRLLVWAGLSLMIASASFIFISTSDENALQVYIRNMQALSLLCMFSLFFRDEHVARDATKAVLVVVVFSVFLNWAEFLHVFGNRLLFSTVPGRSAGLYMDANSSAAALVMGMVLSVFVLPQKLRWWYCLLVATGVLLTFSRGGIILWILAVGGLAWSNVFVLKRGTSVAGLVALAMVFALGLAAGDLIGVFKTAGLESYLDSNTSNRIGKSFLEQNDYSSKARKMVAEQGLSMALEKPLLGWGIGTTKNPATAIAPHNMYVLQGIEFGIVGLFMLCGLIWLIWKEGNERSGVIAVLYAVSNLFNQTNLEQPPVMLILALAIAGIGWRPTGIKGK